MAGDGKAGIAAPGLLTPRLRLCRSPAGQLSAGIKGEVPKVHGTEQVRESELDIAIYERSSGDLVGSIWLSGRMIAYSVRKKMRRRGYGSEAVAAFSSRLLEEPGVDRLYAVIARENIASKALAERAGYRFAGLSRVRIRRVRTIQPLLYIRDG